MYLKESESVENSTLLLEMISINQANFLVNTRLIDNIKTELVIYRLSEMKKNNLYNRLKVKTKLVVPNYMFLWRWRSVRLPGPSSNFKVGHMECSGWKASGFQIQVVMPPFSKKQTFRLDLSKRFLRRCYWFYLGYRVCCNFCSY